MQINLQNVGIVKDSTITIDGLSVITGKNNSGKTTVGKTLYSILDAVSNLQQKANNDKFFYRLNKVFKDQFVSLTSYQAVEELIVACDA